MSGCRPRAAACHSHLGASPTLLYSAAEPAAAGWDSQGPISSSQRPQEQQQTPPLAAQRSQPGASGSGTNAYSRAAYVQHSDAVGLAARRKARSAAAAEEFQLPEGWRASLHAAAAKGLVGKASGRKAQQQQQRYVSPEGLSFGSLAEVQAVVEGPVLVPRKLVRWLRQVAADPLGPAGATAAITAAGQGHLLGLQRCRVALVPGERRRLQRRLEAAAGARAAAQRKLRRTS